MKIALNGNARDEAQTAAFQRRLTARLVNSIFLSASILQVSMIPRGRMKETRRRRITGPRSLNSRCRRNNAAHVCRARSREQCVGVCFTCDEDSRTKVLSQVAGSYLDNSNKICVRLTKEKGVLAIFKKLKYVLRKAIWLD